MSDVYIVPPVVEDCAAFLLAVARSKTLHDAWVHPPSTPAEFADYLHRAAGDRHAPFLVRRRDDDALAGVVNFSEIVHGNFCCAYLGFYALEPHARTGCMRSGLRLAIEYAFEELQLHRIEANIQPANHASLSLVRSLGFRQEGFSPRYLKIDGAWRDHERWALLADEFAPG